MGNGVSAVMAAIMLLLITILIVTLATFFLLRTTQSTATATEQATQALLSCAGASLHVEGTRLDVQSEIIDVYLRNRGNVGETLYFIDVYNIYSEKMPNFTQANITVQPGAVGFVRFNGTNQIWLDLTNSSPSPRPNAQCAGFSGWDSTNNRMIIFGGATDCNTGSHREFSEIWVYTAGNNSWSNISASNAPPPVTSYTGQIILDATRNQFIAFGGVRVATLEYTNETWTYSLTTNMWTNRTTSVAPPGRVGNSAVWNGTHMLIFGGTKSSPNAVFNDLWAYDPASNVWTNITTTGQPSPRYALSGVWDTVSKRMLIFGGYSNTATLDEVWIYDPATNLWSNPNPSPRPPGRGVFLAIWDDFSNEMLVTQGSGATVLNDTWSYDPVANTWEKRAEYHTATFDAFAAWDPVNDQLIVYGGNADAGATFIQINTTRVFRPRTIDCRTFDRAELASTCSFVKYEIPPSGC